VLALWAAHLRYLAKLGKVPADAPPLPTTS
jgi:hypothetical protein